jgi:hypothetical protein
VTFVAYFYETSIIDETGGVLQGLQALSMPSIGTREFLTNAYSKTLMHGGSACLDQGEQRSQ